MRYVGNITKGTEASSETAVLERTAAAERMSYPDIRTGAAGELDLSILQSNLRDCLEIINDEVMKGYLTDLASAEIVPLNSSTLEGMKDIQLFKITELVYDKNEFSADKLSTVFRSLSGKHCMLALMIKCDGVTNSFYLGARPLTDSSPGTMRKMLENTFKGQFPGSKAELYPREKLQEDMQKLCADSLTSVTGVADYKGERDSVSEKGFIQGLEKFVYSMRGRKFTAVFLAESVSHDDLMLRKREYEEIYTQLSPFADMQLNFTVSEGESTSEGRNEGVTHSSSRGVSSGVSVGSSKSSAHTMGESSTHGDTVSEGSTQSESMGSTHTTGHSDTTGESVSDTTTSSVSRTFGSSIGIPGIASVNSSTSFSKGKSHTVSQIRSHAQSVSEAVSKTLSHGTSRNHALSETAGTSSSDTETEGNSTGIQLGTSSSESDSFSLVNSRSLSNSFGSTKGVTLNAKNMTITSILERIKKHLDRFNECESMGMWNFAAYFLGDTVADTETAANTYRALTSGNNSGIECSAVNTWSKTAASGEPGHVSAFKINPDVDMLQNYIKNFIHPEFIYHRHSYDGDTAVRVTPAALVSTNELALHLSLPRHSVKGLPVIEHAAFGQEVTGGGSGTVLLGNIYHLGEDYPDTNVCLDKQSLSMHTFVTGSTGSGKSSTVCRILSEAAQQGVKFLVIEPAKGEYKHMFGSHAAVYGTNPAVSEMLQLDPFSFPKGIHVLEHLDRLIEIFNVCWPMYAAMPAVLKNAVEKSYEDCGWNLTKSTNEFGENMYPCFADVVRNVKSIIDSSEYDTENRGAYKGSLITRLNSLTNGINGLIFSSDEIPGDQLFDTNVIVDLSRVGSSETKSLIMGMLVLKLQEYRMTQGEMNAPLKHITVLEEAHDLLKRTSAEQSAEGGNLLGKSVEMLANAIAEMRTYGEGFIIADQAPGLLDMSVIRNTNTKIIMHLPDQSDRELVGRAANLSVSQITELAKLPKGVAAVYQNEWIQPVLCKVEKYDPPDELYTYKSEHSKDIVFRSDDMLDIAQRLCDCTKMSREEIMEKTAPVLTEQKISASICAAIFDLLQSPPKEPKMTKLAPIMSALFPDVRKAIEKAYSESRDPMDWTAAGERELKNILNPELQYQLRRDIIQAIVTDHVFIKLGRSDDVERWTKEGVR